MSLPMITLLATQLVRSPAIRSQAFCTAPFCKSWLSKLLYPPASKPGASSYREANSNGPNQCFLPVRTNGELNEVLMFSNRVPLILNFTFRGLPQADALTGALNRIVLLETEKRVNVADIETDFLETKEAMLRFGVKQIPTLVSVRKTFPEDHYTLSEYGSGEVDWASLKAWVEKNADDA
ncbi:uncharacterized protein Ecym_2665 [Eremothecium cymbalariae DBVPG|uniref:Thioredoxin domain-containing protein n=1 Tax=Eremothecium cymbalariae (strain CBS 270.75 / DBVPG 7215 / KCTC 17166 / NRRL Y-17582) TaxID=931890 RepID=G8JNV0_ERECY|nr:Hypothetical protein Ecym_2665 [Eremothecium cymbalariae DBVPG\